MNVVNIN